MKKLSLLALVLVVLVTGCGKKKESNKTKGKELVENTGMPVMSEENEKFVDNEGVSDFAFVDDEEPSADVDGKTNKLAEAAPVASGQPEFAWVDGDTPDEETTATEGDEKAFDFKTVNFTLNKNDIRKDQVEKIEKDSEVAKKAVATGKRVVVQGHCCQMGSYSYNMALSQRRADTIKKEMVKRGVSEDSIRTVGYGSEMPLVWSDKTDRKSLVNELAVNRRAEVVIN